MNKLTLNHSSAHTTSELIRRMKMREVFRLLLSGDKYSQTDLSRLLGFSKGTILLIVNKLKEEGLIEEKRRGESKSVGGKRPTILGVRNKNIFILRVAGRISKSKEKSFEMSLINLKGDILESNNLQLEDGLSGEQMLKSLVHGIERQKSILFRNNNKANIIAVALAMGGRVNPIEGKLISSTGAFKQLVGLEIQKNIFEATGLRTFLEDSAVFPAYREYYLGAASDLRSFVYLQVLPFIRAITFLNGVLYRGESFSAGQIGASIGRMGDCENEYLCDLFDHEIFGLPLLKERRDRPINLHQVYDFAKRADKGLQRPNDNIKAESLARITGQTIVNIICYIDVPHIVVGGVPDNMKELFREKVVKEVERNLFFANSPKLDIRFPKVDVFGRGKEMGFVCFIAENLFYE